MANAFLQTPNRRIAAVALVIFGFDQLTKFFVLRLLGKGEERVIVDGFFKFVHWGNTGAAWSMFRGNNELLAIIALVALLVLFLGVHTLGRPASATGEALLCAGVAATLAALLSGGFALATALFEDLDPLLQLPGGVATGAPFLSAFLTGLALWTPVVWLARRRWAPLGLSWRDA